MPGTLSGGEQQRVALARALAPEPGVVLLDEPFSSLDAGLRWQLRSDVRSLLKGIGVTTILVTHDQDEALTFGDRVAVMRAGTIEQVGSPPDDLRPPGVAVGRHVRRRGQPPRRPLRRQRCRHGDRPAADRCDRRAAGRCCAVPSSCVSPRRVRRRSAPSATSAGTLATRSTFPAPARSSCGRPVRPITSPAISSRCASPPPPPTAGRSRSIRSCLFNSCKRP